MLDAVGEGLQDSFFEIRTRVRFHDLGTLFFGNGVKANAEDIMFNAAGNLGDLGFHVQWNLWGGV